MVTRLAGHPFSSVPQQSTVCVTNANVTWASLAGHFVRNTKAHTKWPGCTQFEGGRVDDLEDAFVTQV